MSRLNLSGIVSPAVLALLLGCGGSEVMPTVPPTPMPEFSSVTPAQWEALGRQRIFFGHQSVGRNILAGIDAVLTAHPGIRLHVAQGVPSDSAPGLYHDNVGQNGDIASKTGQFDAATDSAKFDAAILKFCYVDVTGEVGPDSLFANYQRWIATLRQRHPDLRIVHATLPLTDLDGRRDWLVGLLKGQKTKRDLNLIRYRYNTLLLREYAGREPVFDIAAIESTRPDGSRVTFRYKGLDVPVLNPDITDDGGHLNAVGQQRAAEAFLALLASSY